MNYLKKKTTFSFQLILEDILGANTFTAYCPMLSLTYHGVIRRSTGGEHFHNFVSHCLSLCIHILSLIIHDFYPYMPYVRISFGLS